MALKFKRRKAAKKNPTKRKRRARRNPAKAVTKYRTRTRTVTKYRTRKNPAKSHRRRRTRRNPSGRGILAGIKAGAPYVLGIGGGVLVGIFGVKYIPSQVPVRIRGIIPTLLGLIVASVSRSTGLRNFGYGLGGAGILDLARNNIPMLALSEISTLQEIPALNGMGDSVYALNGMGPVETLGGPLDTLGAMGEPVMAMPSLGDFDTF